MRSEHKSEHRVIILGDSHAHGLAGRLKVTLKDIFEVIGYTKCNCNVKTLIGSAKGDITNLSKKDVHIFLGISNDICHNNIDRNLSHISQFVQRNTHTSIIISTAPHCYDSVASCNVNQEVQIFNKNLKKYMKQNTHATILEMEHDRKYFTNPDLHLNNMNMEYICK